MRDMKEMSLTMRSISTLILLAFCSAVLPFANAAGEARPKKQGPKKRMVILNSYNDGAPWAQEIIAPIMGEMSHQDNFHPVDIVYLNNTQIHSQQDFDRVERGIAERFADKRPDYVVLIGNFSFTLRDMVVREWGEVPMLLVAQDDVYGPDDFYYTYPGRCDTVCATRLLPLENLRDIYNFTLVQTPNLYKETIDMMAHMQPQMKKLVFIADELYINRHLSHKINDYLKKDYPGIKYEWLIGNQYNSSRLQQYLNENDPSTGLLLSTWFFERTTVNGYPQLIAGEARLISGARRPVFGLRSAYMGYGITGGYFPSTRETERNTINTLRRMIRGERMSDIPFMRTREAYPLVNWDKLERDSIPVSVCPPGTHFINRPKSMWELYSTYIVAAVIILLAMVAFIVGYFIFQRRRMAMMRAHNRLVSTMPIAYTQASVAYDGRGEVTDIDYHDGNMAFEELLSRNSIPGEHRKIFERKKISDEVRTLLDRREPVRFTHHFSRTDTDYDFLLSLDSTEIQKNVNEINVFAVDITEQKKQEAALVAARERAMESDKLKMSFLANMSHEIRTPLNAIVGFSELLAKTEDNEKKKRFIQLIETNNALLLQLVSDVLDIAKVESNSLDFNFRITDLNELMRGIEPAARLRMKPGVALNMSLGAPECHIDTDPNRLTQVINNLLNNAAKFTAKGNVTFGYEPRPEGIYFFVRDTGIGITKEDSDKLFIRFSKVDNFVQGSGLGLSICKSIVELLGGRIGFSSEGKGKGSLFWFIVPDRATLYPE